MNYFCTLFNHGYLSRGLVMLASLQRESTAPYRIFVLAMDDLAGKILTELQLPNVKVIALTDFENADLLGVKAGRTVAEYCWTCTPAIIRYCLEKFQLPECTYLDADLYFLNNPQILLSEVRESGKSVMITPHNYTPYFDQSKTSGIYCVQFMYFNNDSSGLTVLNDWYSKCIEWCFNRFEGGKLGDQKYLDQWPIDFRGKVHDLIHLGSGAPWNIQKYNLTKENQKLWLNYRGIKNALIFYHFHSLNILENQKIFYSLYPLSNNVESWIYKPYVQELLEFDREMIKKYKLPELVASRSRMLSADYFTFRYRLRMLFWKVFYFVFKL
jgi:hypothetical protein